MRPSTSTQRALTDEEVEAIWRARELACAMRHKMNRKAKKGEKKGKK